MRGRAGFCDWWSLLHFCVWLVVGALARWRLRGRRPLWAVVAGTLLAAYLWEITELAIAKAPFLWSNRESSLNRWVSDPLMALVGVPLGWWARAAIQRWRSTRSGRRLHEGESSAITFASGPGGRR
jgi:hypothetical protein